MRCCRGEPRGRAGSCAEWLGGEAARGSHPCCKCGTRLCSVVGAEALGTNRSAGGPIRQQCCAVRVGKHRDPGRLWALLEDLTVTLTLNPPGRGLGPLLWVSVLR